MSEFPYERKEESIENLGEIIPSNEFGNESTLSSSSKYKWDEQTFKQKTGKKYVTFAEGTGLLNTPYLYANGKESVIAKVYFKGVTSVNVRGYRPMKKLRCTIEGGYYTTTVKYINKFSDGEVWISSSSNSRTGTKISTAEQDRHFFIFEMCAAGGGGAGGGGSSSKNGGGGGAGGYDCFMMKLFDNRVFKITVGKRGLGGAGNLLSGENGSAGEDSKIERVGYDAQLCVTGGSGGLAASSGGAGGERNTVSSWIFWPLYMTTETNGKGKSGGSAGNYGGDSLLTIVNNTPEHEMFALSENGGSPGSALSAGGGGGGASLLGAGGHGAGSAEHGKKPTSGFGGGGGGGIWSVINNYRGGHGAPGVVNIYY